MTSRVAGGVVLVTGANELIMTIWNPVSQQPYFKTATCRVTRTRAGDDTAEES